MHTNAHKMYIFLQKHLFYKKFIVNFVNYIHYMLIFQAHQTRNSSFFVCLAYFIKC